MAFTEGLIIPYSLNFGGMYELTITIRTDTDPHGLLYQIREDVKEHVNVLGMDYHLISPRPTDIEHHGGDQTN